MEYLKQLTDEINEAWDYDEQKELYLAIWDYIATIDEAYNNTTKSDYVIIKSQSQRTKKQFIFDLGQYELILIKICSDNNLLDEAMAYAAVFEAKDEANRINKETFYKVPYWFLMAGTSTSRAKSGKYYLTKGDEAKGYYITVEFEGISYKMPFRGLFDSNKKLDGIPSLSFSTAKDCPSRRAGTCQLCDPTLCYAVRGERQARATHSGKGILSLNSYNKSLMDAYILNRLTKEPKNLKKLIDYINSNFEAIRFNKKGDFKNRHDWNLIKTLATNCKGTVFYGYTARDDIFKTFEDEPVPNNIYLNGSNRMYTNRFKTTSDLKEYIEAPLKCLGDCKRCQKCYNLKEQTITCLLHGSSVDPYFNTAKNRAFLINWFNRNFSKLELTDEALTVNKGLLTSLNKALSNNPLYKDWHFETLKDLVKYIQAMGWD